jgi:DNA-directed RNA polymerase subunit RPC12/RpoP
MLKCHKCRTPFAAGTLGEGSRLEIKCRRCKERFFVVVV